MKKISEDIIYPVGFFFWYSDHWFLLEIFRIGADGEWRAAAESQLSFCFGTTRILLPFSSRAETTSAVSSMIGIIKIIEILYIQFIASSPILLAAKVLIACSSTAIRKERGAGYESTRVTHQQFCDVRHFISSTRPAGHFANMFL